MQRFLGFDLGNETVRVAELVDDGGGLRIGRTWSREHGKDPRATIAALLDELDWDGVAGAAATGRMAPAVQLDRIPQKAAVAEGVAVVAPEDGACTVVSIGSHGFAVIDVLEDGTSRIRENSRCSQGTGNFLRQLVERLDVSLPEADRLCEDVAEPAPLSGRCPVLLKTDLTHLANRGEDRGRILAGLYDAVCENVQSLIRPPASPRPLRCIGGVTRSKRIQRNFAAVAERHGMPFAGCDAERDGFIEAFGAAAVAARKRTPLPTAGELVVDQVPETFSIVPGLGDALARVHRMTAPETEVPDHCDVLLGFDIGSTGAKALAIDVATDHIVWQGYLNTLGDPVGASQKLVARFIEESAGRFAVRGVGATGSGREIVGSLLASCFGPEHVFVMNEIAAHATGALQYDPEVDTIFEIGGQDAKYIRLDGGRICDAAMNEACSAGTGSFIEEQGSKFEGVEDVVQMGECAAQSDHAVGLGQHCSVFMAEVIDKAVVANQSSQAILAGIYDSVIQNYLNRVKGTRSVGNRIFCQGMPFMSDALAGAVARQTGSDIVIPPNPGTVGALGIALLARTQVEPSPEPMALEGYLEAHVSKKDRFVCRSTVGCGDPGNRCKIDRLRIDVAGTRKQFTWGGSCSLFDKGLGRNRLPSDAPDPFRQREQLVEGLLGSLTDRAGRPTVALTDEFSLKGLLPFFATFVHALGLNVQVLRHATQRDLKAGILRANVPYCAPMQLFHGSIERLVKDEPEILLVPSIRELPRLGQERYSTTCPVVQSAPDLMREAFLRDGSATRLVAPTIRMGQGNLTAPLFRQACRDLAKELGAGRGWEAAFDQALAAQRDFDAGCLRLGEEALAYAKEHGVTAVVVLGRSYTIYNGVLNSNVPDLLREQGRLSIPLDCYPVGDDAPVFHSMYWHYGQLILRAAHQIRRSEGVYGVMCSNYGCGPDSFNGSFFRHIMENKPYAFIETDGHSGDAGTKTRIEAFLFCVDGDAALPPEERARAHRTDFARVEADNRTNLIESQAAGDTMLIGRMGVASEALAALLRGEGMRAEALPVPTAATLDLGRRYTSGKECLPMSVSLGSLLERLEASTDPTEQFAVLVPGSEGSCRLGTYHLLYKIALNQAGWGDRVKILSPHTENYFAGLSPGFEVRFWTAVVAAETLYAAWEDVAPVETAPGAADRVWEQYHGELLDLIEGVPPADLWPSMREAAGGMNGIRDLVERAAAAFRAVKDFEREVPTVNVVGEIYVRLDPFSNGDIVKRLHRAGLRARTAPLHEWVEYVTWWNRFRMANGMRVPGDSRVGLWVTAALQEGVAATLYATMADALGWGRRPVPAAAVDAAAPYADHDLSTETNLTLGTAIHEFLAGEAAGAVSVGPLECMPNKIAESHFERVDADLGLPSVTFNMSGEPVDQAAVDAFAYEVRERWDRSRERQEPGQHAKTSWSDLAWTGSGRLLFRVLRAIGSGGAAAAADAGDGARSAPAGPPIGT